MYMEANVGVYQLLKCVVVIKCLLKQSLDTISVFSFLYLIQDLLIRLTPITKAIACDSVFSIHCTCMQCYESRPSSCCIDLSDTCSWILRET